MRVGEADFGNSHISRFESFVLTKQVEQAFREKAGDEKQGGASENLQADHQGTKPAALPCPGYPAAALLERCLRIGAHKPERRQDAEQKAGPDGQGHGKKKHGQVEMNFGQARQIDRRVPAKETESDS